MGILLAFVEASIPDMLGLVWRLSAAIGCALGFAHAKC